MDYKNCINLKKAMVTGGAGFIGSHLVHALTDLDCHVVVIDNLSTGHMGNLSHIKKNITFIKGNICDKDLILKESKNCDAIFHQAAVVSVPLSVKDPVNSAMVNIMGTLNILDAARQNSIKSVVLASSSAVYGNIKKLPAEESSPISLLSPYAVQKYTGELNAKNFSDLFGINTICLRYFNVYGPRQDPGSPYSGVISLFIKKATEKKQPAIFGDGNQLRDFIFVKDVVKANILAAGSAKSNIFNIGLGNYISINKLWKEISHISKFYADPEYKEERAGDIKKSWSNIKKAGKQINYIPDFSFNEGLKLTYNWYMENKKSAL